MQHRVVAIIKKILINVLEMIIKFAIYMKILQFFYSMRIIKHYNE